MSSSTITAIPRINPVQVNRVLAFAIVVILPAVCWSASQIGIAAYAGFCLLGIAALIFLHTAKQTFGSYATLIAIFGTVAAIHACVAYLLLDLITPDIWPASSYWTYVPSAFLVVAAGLLSAALGYFAYAGSSFAFARGMLGKLSVEDGKLLRAALWLTLGGAVLIFAIYASVGYLPLLADNPGQSRYLTEEVSDSYRVQQWLVQRGLDLITIAVPLLMWNWRRKFWYAAASFVGIAGCLLPLRRTPFLVIAITVGALGAVTAGKIQKKYLIAALVILIAYGGTQLLFLPAGSDQTGSQRLFYAAAASATEIRDFAWMMSRSSEPWYGVTFLQPVIPLPSFMDDFSQKYKLGEITIRLMQLENDRKTGGLRMTLAGEAYMNFGFLGVTLLGYLFGIGCALVDTLSRWARARNQLGTSYAVALLFVWLCFWIYLSGSGMAAALKVSIALAFLMFFSSRLRGDVDGSAA